MPTRTAPRPPLAPTTGVGPGWFGSVMGTGILAVVLAPHAAAAALALWLVAASLLGVLGVVVVVQERSYLDHPVQRHYYGAPAMALMTVGAGALATQGHALPVVLLAGVLWTAGTVLGVVTSVAVPRASAGAPLADVGPWWLMPVVPPTVSATTGALLVPHLPPGPPQTVLVLLCYVLLVLSVLGTVRVLGLLVGRVRAHGFGPAASTPTWFIVLGPLGQSVTALHHLGGPVSWLGPPVVVAALAWMAVAAALVVRARPAFSLAWWSFTFPVATVATACAALGWTPAVSLLTAVLVVTWSVAAAGTLRGLRDGSLLRP